MAVCDYIYLDGLRFASGSAAVDIEIDGKIRRLAVVRNGKGRSRLDRWEPEGREDGCVGEINLRDLQETLTLAGKTSTKAEVTLLHTKTELNLDPSKAMGREGREVTLERLRELLYSVPPHIAREIAITQLHTLPYGAENASEAQSRLSAITPFMLDGDVRQAVLEGAENVMMHALPKTLNEMREVCPRDAAWLSDMRKKAAEVAATGLLGAVEAEIATVSAASEGRLARDAAIEAGKSQYATDEQLRDIITRYDAAELVSEKIELDTLRDILLTEGRRLALNKTRESYETYMKTALAMVEKGPENIRLLTNSRGQWATIPAIWSWRSPGADSQLSGDRGGVSYHREIFDTVARAGSLGVELMNEVFDDIEQSATDGERLYPTGVRDAVRSYVGALSSVSFTEEQAENMLQQGGKREQENIKSVLSLGSTEKLTDLTRDTRPEVRTASLLQLHRSGRDSRQELMAGLHAGVVPSLALEVLREIGTQEDIVSYVTSSSFTHWDRPGRDHEPSKPVISYLYQDETVNRDDAVFRRMVRELISDQRNTDRLREAFNAGRKSERERGTFGSGAALVVLEEIALLTKSMDDIEELNKLNSPSRETSQETTRELLSGLSSRQLKKLQEQHGRLSAAAEALLVEQSNSAR